MKRILVALLVIVSLCIPASAGQRAIDLQTSVETLRAVTYQIRNGRSGCSAVAYAPTALITAAHCGDIGDEARIFDDKQFVGTAKFVAIDDNADLAVLVRTDALTFHTTVPIAAENVVRDTPVVVVGYPLGIAEFATYGWVQDVQMTEEERESKSSKARREKTAAPYKPFEVYVIAAPVSFGNSGGGAFVKVDGEWQLIGICSMGAFGPGSVTTYIGLFVSTREIRAFLKV